MRGIPRSAWRVVPLWAAAVGAAILSRPLLPIDETRYIAVAWEMWNGGDYLVPHLNGQVYSHKPPLLFWLINAGWSVFGVHEWVARLVGPAFALADFCVTGFLARALWPNDAQAPVRAAAALLAFPVFALYSTLLMFDAMLTFFVLIALLGIVSATRGGSRASIAIAIGAGGGILAKGPVVLVYLLPVIVAAPWWSSTVRPAWKPFARRVAAGLACGAALALAWAIPAALFGGAEYREAILWTQTAGRLTQSSAHHRPFWFYLALLPGALFPWAYWGPFREGFQRGASRDEGRAFCTVWFAGGLVLISLISGKQVHYLLPLLPAAALIAARASGLGGDTLRRPVIVAGVYALAAAGSLLAAVAMPDDLNVTLQAGLGPVLMMAGVIAGAWWLVSRRREAGAVFWWSAAACVGFSAAVQWMASPSLRAGYDPTPLALELSKLQNEGRPLLHRNDYHGQFHFAGRLTQPLPAAKSEEALRAWCVAHPDGLVIKYWDRGTQPYAGQTEFVGRFRGRAVGLVHAAAFLNEAAPVNPAPR